MKINRNTVWAASAICLALLLGIAGTQRIHAQGCIIAHSVGQIGGPETNGGYLAPGHWQLSVDYRHQYSFRHFVGSVEQTYRAQGHSEVRNRINLVDTSAIYQITPRFSAVVTIPMQWASRRYYIKAGSIDGRPASDIIGNYGTSGVGDISFIGQGWLWNPVGNPSHNIQIGFGVQTPTGRKNIANNLVESPGQPSVTAIADYSIQPGIGVWAMPITLESFQTVGKQEQIYFNGSYLLTPAETNGVSNTPPPGFPPPPSQNAFISAADEYLMQAGFSYTLKTESPITITAGLRKEGVPAHDLIGGDEGFRRPGYAVSVEPGLIYNFHSGHDLIIANIDRAIYRNRVPSVPDMQLGGKGGDAAFADWVWLATFQHRF